MTADISSKLMQAVAMAYFVVLDYVRQHAGAHPQDLLRQNLLYTSYFDYSKGKVVPVFN
jgi:hypothetical protein